MSSPNLSVCGLPFTEIASDVPASAVVSVIGTTCVQLPLLPGFSPMRSNCAVRYATVLSSPGLPGARPSKASDESTRTCSAKSPFARSGTNAWEDVVATAGAAAVALAAGACDDGARLQAASATTPAMHTIKLRDFGERTIRGASDRDPPDSNQTGCRTRLPVAGRRVRAEGNRLRAGDRAYLGRGVHVEHHLALEHQRAVHLRIRTDDDARRLVLVHREPARAGLLDMDAAVHVRADAHGDVAVDRLDARAQVRVDQADRAVHRFHALGDVAAAVDEDAAVHRLDAIGDARLGAHADAAVHGGQPAGAHVVEGLDAAVDCIGVAGARARFDADAAVDGRQIAVGLAGLGGDAAVDLVDVFVVGLGGGGTAGEGHCEAQGEGEAGARHGERPWNRWVVRKGCVDRAIGLTPFATIRACPWSCIPPESPCPTRALVPSPSSCSSW